VLSAWAGRGKQERKRASRSGRKKNAV